MAQNHLSHSKLVFGLHDISCVMRFEAAKAARSARASDSSCFHCFESIKTDAHAQSPKDTWSRNDFFFESVFGNFDLQRQEQIRGQFCKQFRG